MRFLNHPFLCNLHYAFQTSKQLFLVMDFCQGGELYFHIKQNKHFSEDVAKFYAAEIILALEYLHKKNIVYRDLKPENVLITSEGHIKLVDFGLSKRNVKKDCFTFCGTPEYLAPEIIMETGYNKIVDWWSLGILVYEMVTGRVPYMDTNVYRIYKNILSKPIEMKDTFSTELNSLLSGLLTINPEKRLGNRLMGSEEIK